MSGWSLKITQQHLGPDPKSKKTCRLSSTQCHVQEDRQILAEHSPMLLDQKCPCEALVVMEVVVGLPTIMFWLSSVGSVFFLMLLGVIIPASLLRV